MLSGETILSGASPHCSDCGVNVEFEVLESPAGWYIGTQCNCGPYTRESNYFKSKFEAEIALKTNIITWARK